jgi:hypothetical protein
VIKIPDLLTPPELLASKRCFCQGTGLSRWSNKTLGLCSCVRKKLLDLKGKVKRLS